MPPSALPAKYAAAKAYNAFNLASFTVGVKNTNTINVAVQLKDARGRNVSQVVRCRAMLSDASTGIGITGTATTSPLAIGTNGSLLYIPVTGKMVEVESDASGRFDLNIIQTAGGTNNYLVVFFPDGSIAVSTVIAF